MREMAMIQFYVTGLCKADPLTRAHLVAKLERRPLTWADDADVVASFAAFLEARCEVARLNGCRCADSTVRAFQHEYTQPYAGWLELMQAGRMEEAAAAWTAMPGWLQKKTDPDLVGLALDAAGWSNARLCHLTFERFRCFCDEHVCEAITGPA
jgi:hypothetical protein